MLKLAERAIALRAHVAITFIKASERITEAFRRWLKRKERVNSVTLKETDNGKTGFNFSYFVLEVVC
jgi:hypothetical protein